ncbi:hypothetical protein EDD21DRAFT_351315 [Dissophora ornata]|nr:hypothetical protein BGZ58_000868 [Dissophora ornata]KAI8604010.1 hypothetical protein EDD21DRAFT_351315 [Dissophora ornata]
MRFDITALAIVAALVAPALAAQTFDVIFVNGTFSPKVLDISAGDTVRWPNDDGAIHAIVETIPGPRSCTSKQVGGFNSGPKTQGEAYLRTFHVQAVVNYKDGIGANCINGATGTIYVGPRPSNATGDTGSTTTQSMSASSTVSSSVTTSVSGTTVTTQTTAPTTSPTHAPNAAAGFSVQNSLAISAVALIGALVAF